MAEQPTPTNFVEIDGSYLEGGGQALRNALSLSCILRRPVRVFNIRANRPKPGLANQHLHGLNLLRDITNAEVKGNALNSTEVEFSPRSIRADTYKVDTRTAASVTLVYQMALPVLLFGSKSSRLDVTGGTNVAFAPQVEFMQDVLAPNLRRFGVSIDLKVLHHGFYPRGNGRCLLDIEPLRTLQAAEITDFGELKSVVGWSYCAGRLPKSIAHDMQQTALREMHRLWPDSATNINVIKHSQEKARDNGAGIILTALTTSDCVLGSTALGDKKIDGHTLGCDASCALASYIKQEICVDEYLQDQLIIYMALATGCSRIRTGNLTKHTRTAIHVAELMTGVKFEISPEVRGQTLLSCVGLGQSNALLQADK